MANYTEDNYDPSKHGYWKGTIDGEPNYGWPSNYYYADVIRTIMIAFGNFFNELKVVRRNKLGEPIKIINVPIKYGPRQKSHDFRTEQESGDTYYISLPNITYKYDSINYAPERDSGIYETRAFYSDTLNKAGIDYELEDQFWSDTQPSPVNINVSMEINCEKIDDLNQIIEQILPRYRPACFLAVKEFWWCNKRRSIKVKMENPGIQIDSDSMGEEDRREVKGTISFTIEAVMYLPVRSAQIIEKINTFVQMDKTAGAIWHGQTYGNSDGTLTTPHDFSKIYGTKVANTYVLNGTPETTYNEETSAYTTIYNYRQTEDLTTYDSDAKLLTKMVRQWSPAENPIYIDTELYDEENYRYYTSAVPQINTWVTTKEYAWLSGWGENDDMSISYGSKTLYSEDNVPYSAYYSTYSEQSTVDKMKYSFDVKHNKLTYSGKYDKQNV